MREQAKDVSKPYARKGMASVGYTDVRIFIYGERKGASK